MRRFGSYLLLGALWLVVLATMWSAFTSTARLVLEAAGVDTIPLHDLDSGDVDGLLNELVAVADLEAWDHPADALFPFEDDNLDRRQLEQAMVRCSGAPEG